MAGVAAAGALFGFSRYFARPPPHTMTKEYQESSDEYLKVRLKRPIGINRDCGSTQCKADVLENEHLRCHRVSMSSQSLVFPPRTGRVATWFSPSQARNRGHESVVEVRNALVKAMNRFSVSMVFWRNWQPLISKQGYCKAKDESWCIDKWTVERISASNVQRAVSSQIL